MRLKVKNIILLVPMCVCVMSFMLSSCEMKEEVEVKDAFIPKAANQFAVDKETDTVKVEETKAHHNYKEIELPSNAKIIIENDKFLTKINYIKNHIDEFKNSTITIEGMYGLYKSWDETFVYPMVYRNGPGCCGDDQYGGFYLINIDESLYEIDDWIRVSGTPFMYEHTDSEGEVQKFLFLVVGSIETLSLKDRKAEMVND